MITVTVTLPIKTVSGTNMHEHHFARHARVKRERSFVRTWSFSREAAALRRQLAGAAVVGVTFTRLAPGLLDVGNLSTAFKGVQDELCAIFGLDDSPRGGIEWAYQQERVPRGPRGAPPLYAVRVEIRAQRDIGGGHAE